MDKCTYFVGKPDFYLTPLNIVISIHLKHKIYVVNKFNNPNEGNTALQMQRYRLNVVLENPSHRKHNQPTSTFLGQSPRGAFEEKVANFRWKIHEEGECNTEKRMHPKSNIVGVTHE